jgi:hypothetical protein
MLLPHKSFFARTMSLREAFPIKGVTQEESDINTREFAMQASGVHVGLDAIENKIPETTLFKLTNSMELSTNRETTNCVAT